MLSDFDSKQIYSKPFYFFLQLREFDKELNPFREELHEYPIHFPPRYVIIDSLIYQIFYFE